MRRLIWLLLLVPTLALADGATVIRRQAAPPVAFTSENFDPAGYQLTWSENTSGTVILDEDETATCPAGTGFGSTQCMEINVDAVNEKAYIITDLGSAITSTVYTTIYLYIVSLAGGGTTWVEGDTQPIMLGSDTNVGVPSASSGMFAVSLVYDANGVAADSSWATSPDCSPLSACWRFETKCGSTAEGAQYLQANTGTIYRFRFQTTTSSIGTCQAFIDSTQVVTNADNDAGAYQYLWLGPWTFTEGAQVELFDSLTWSLTGYVP